jgi:hypothetical protein
MNIFPGFEINEEGLWNSAKCACVIGPDAVEAARALVTRCPTFWFYQARNVPGVVARLEAVDAAGCLVIENFDDLDLCRKDVALFQDAIHFHLQKWKSEFLWNRSEFKHSWACKPIFPLFASSGTESDSGGELFRAAPQ